MNQPVHPQSSGSPPPRANDEPALHNSVLTRSHEPPRSGDHRWLMIVPLGVVIIAGAAFWAYVQTHPASPLVNRSVLTSPATPSTSSNG